MENPPYLRNRRTGVILPYNEHLATHPDMHPCDELPYPKEVKKPTTPTHRRYMSAQAAKAAKAEKAEKAEKVKKQAEPPRKKAEKQAEPEAEPPGNAEINDLLAGIEHG